MQAGLQVLGRRAGPAQDLTAWRPQCAVAPLEGNKEQRVRGGATSPAHTQHAHKCTCTRTSTHCLFRFKIFNRTEVDGVSALTIW